MPKVIFSIPFTGKTIHGDGFKGQDWYKHRADIFKNYTLRSLANQTDKDFLVWLQFRPQEIENATTKKIEQLLKKSKLKYVLTFYSPIMMEDRATWHNQDLTERAEKSLRELGETKEDYVVEVGLDSDDMVYKDFVRLLKTREMKEGGAFYMTKGFVYSSIDDKLAHWNNPTSMSIYAIVYPTSIFLNAKKHFEYQNGFNSHEQIPKLFDAEKLPDGMYCALIHGNNISTIWEHPFRGDEIFYADEKLFVLEGFGI